jgi:hypothetical protein
MKQNEKNDWNKEKNTQNGIKIVDKIKKGKMGGGQAGKYDKSWSLDELIHDWMERERLVPPCT